MYFYRIHACVLSFFQKQQQPKRQQRLHSASSSPFKSFLKSGSPLFPRKKQQQQREQQQQPEPLDPLEAFEAKRHIGTKMLSGNVSVTLTREDLIKLYLMKLDEEANYFKANSPVDDEICNCPKCQVGKRIPCILK